MVDPLIDDADFRLFVGDALELARQQPDASVDCIVTSPPYWGLRDYGTGTWDGGDPGCDHTPAAAQRATRPDNGLTGGKATIDAGTILRGGCHCGATRVDQQLGLEPTPDEYVARMVEVFRELRRLLSAGGTLWLNIGDSYAGGGRGGHTPRGLKPKDLVGIPWLLAFALRADGWWLRSEIIWAKPNPMPESVTDRPTKAHEQIFLLTKSPRYYFDQEAVREGDQGLPSGNAEPPAGHSIPNNHRGRSIPWEPTGAGRNSRSVWTITTEPYPAAHFATFPTELARRCIAAGCPEGGTVLDPFMGSGTVAFVARKLGRRCVGFELNPAYAELIAQRTSQQSLLA